MDNYKAMPQQEAIIQFIDQLIKDAGLSEMSQDFLDDYKEQLTMELMKRLGLQVLNTLSDEQREEALTFMQTNPTPQEIDEFYRKKLPNINEVTKNTLEEFRREYLTKAQTLKSAT